MTKTEYHTGAPQPQSPEAEPPVRRVLVFVIIAAALMMMAVDGTIVATALEALKHGLNTTVNWAGWTITAYALGYVVMLPVSGKLTARYGNRKVFLGSVLTFTLASLFCGLATNIYMLIALRVLQALGGGGFTPSATGIIVQHFGDARDRAVGLFGSIFPMGAMIGPVFGALFVTYWSWRGIFLVNVPLGLSVLAFALRFVPSDRTQESQTRARVDIAGLGLLSLGLLAGMLAATYMNARLWSAAFVGPAIIALVALIWFFWRLNHRSNPVLAPRLVHGPGFGIVNAVNLLYGGTTVGVLVLVPLYAANRYGLSTFDAGMLLIAQGVGAIVFSALAAIVLRNTGYRPPIYVGAGLIAAGMALLAIPAPHGISPLVWLAGATFLVGVGAGTVNPATRNAGLQLEPDLAPSIAAVRSMCMQVGKIVAVSVVTAILANAGTPGQVQSWVYATMAVVLLCAMPIIGRIPEHRGTW